MHDHSYYKNLFLIDPAITYLNFGSFGACPKPVFEDYQQWQLLLEREPVQFIAFDGFERIRHSLAALAGFIDCDPMDLVYTPNPTYAINIIAENLQLSSGDEILSTDLEYGAMDRTWDYYCNRNGATYIRQRIELPIQSKEHFLEAFWRGYTEKTKAVFLSHITSATALILPAEEICKEARRRGLITIVDGAHVPAHAPLSIRKLDADFYTGACHKWMMAPKGCSFLFAKKSFQDTLDPIVISWGYKSDNPTGSLFFDHHQFNGTRDFSAYLTIPKAIQFMQDHDWEKVSQSCRQLVHQYATDFCNLTGGEPLAPIVDEFIGQMFAIPIQTNDPAALQRRLFEHYRIEIPITRQADRIFARYSIQAFNSIRDLDALYSALEAELKHGKLITSVEK